MTMFYNEQKSLLISGSSDGTLRAWNVDTGLCLAILKGHSGIIREVQFDNGKIISCSMDKTIRIWSLKTFECVRTIEGLCLVLVFVISIITFDRTYIWSSYDSLY